MVSLLNHPDFTAYSPRTIPAITLRGVVSILGVLTAASRRPSMANSSIRSCQIKGTLSGSDSWIKASQSGMSSVFCINRSHVGVKSRDSRDMVILDRRRYVPVIGGK